jgi:hypothetical protein
VIKLKIKLDVLPGHGSKNFIRNIPDNLKRPAGITGNKKVCQQSESGLINK